MIFDKLNDDLQKCNALPILFVGTGISRRYLGMDDWLSLLKYLASIVFPENVHAFEHFKQVAISELKSNNLIKDGIISTNILYPKIAGLIDIELGKIYYTDPRFKDSIETYSEDLSSGGSPIKIEVAKYLKEKSKPELLNPEYSEEISLLQEIAKTSIAGAITTNYDTFLEMILNNEYKVYIGQDDLLFSSLLEISEIYKIHGSLTNPGSIVLTDDDYRNFDEKNQYLAAKLLTMFLEHPIIFLGYSVQDENIRGILKSISKCLSPEKSKSLKDRMIFIERLGSGESEEVSTYTISTGESRHIEMTRIKTNNFIEVYRCIKNVKAKYPVKWLKRLKNDVYDLIVKADAESKVVVMDLNDKVLDKYEIVVGVGIQKLGRRGYASITAAEIYHDILFNDGDFINQFMIEETLPRLIKGNNPLPVYKYLSEYDLENNEFFKKYAAIKYDDFLNSTLKSMTLKIDCINDKSLNNYKLCSRMNQIAKLGATKEISTDELYAYLANVLHDYPNALIEKKSTYLSSYKRLIRIYDYLKFYLDK
jgi:hypothetical protein